MARSVGQRWVGSGQRGGHEAGWAILDSDSAPEWTLAHGLARRAPLLPAIIIAAGPRRAGARAAAGLPDAPIAPAFRSLPRPRRGGAVGRGRRARRRPRERGSR